MIRFPISILKCSKSHSKRCFTTLGHKPPKNKNIINFVIGSLTLTSTAAGFIYFNKTKGRTSAYSSLGTISNNKPIPFSDSFCSFETDFLPKSIDGHDCEKPDAVNPFNFIANLYESYLKAIYQSQNNTLILANEALWQVAISTVLVQPFFYARVNYQLGKTLSFKPSVIFRGVIYNLIPRLPSTFVVWGTQSSFD